jgi:hypothetical protein
MSVLMPETTVVGRHLVAAELEPHGVIDHLGQVVGDLDIGADVDVTGALKGTRIGILAPAHRYGEAGPVVMALLKARIFAAIRDRADKGMAKGETPVVLLMDEAQEVTTKQDALILGIARSLNLAIVASTQTVEGIEARLGQAEAAQFLTLFGSVIALQNRSAMTTRVVAARLGASFRPTLDAVPGVPTVRDVSFLPRCGKRSSVTPELSSGNHRDTSSRRSAPGARGAIRRRCATVTARWSRSKRHGLRSAGLPGWKVCACTTFDIATPACSPAPGCHFR